MINKPIVLLYDCDTKKHDQDYTDCLLHIRKIPINEQNTRYKRGVENLLNLESDFDYPAYFVETESEQIDEYGASTKVAKQKLNKTKLCHDICAHQAHIVGRLASMKQLLSNLKMELESAYW